MTARDRTGHRGDLSAMTNPKAATYSYDNDHPSAAAQHNALSMLLDPVSTAHLNIAVGDLTGARCLEAGAGGSQVPVWLAERVGPTGLVVATDLQPHHISEHPQIEVLRHDLRTGPVPGGPFDVIHARLVLIHLRKRLRVLADLAAQLAPGGVLCIEEWLLWPDHAVLAAPTPQAGARFAAYQRAVIDLLTTNGADPTWATRTLATMQDLGLRDVYTRIDSPVWEAGSPGLALVGVNLAQHRGQLRERGLTDTDLDQIAAMAADPSSGLVVRGHPLYTTIGRPHTPAPRAAHCSTTAQVR
jgi:SAM-dependent methyltransferase